ncbi:gamma-glutamyltransferase family protein [Nesterenkonia alba]|uniref:gamma-glutamyltransferase family protein n=1 Tax=Nesterenkonia alba TaxID=515814 RepID=UPI0003B50EDB|nr:gamma-glutamyltransferase [Nesterenkonia alba]
MTFAQAENFTTRPTLQGSFGMSASTHWLATGAAQSVLERGGNAFDAAAAGAFVLHVVEPHLNGPGGEVPAIFTTAEQPHTPRVLMGQGPAPARASIEHYRALGLETVPGAGGLAAPIPGAVDAWLLLVRDHGVATLEEVLGYAIYYAAEGHPILPRVASALASVEELFTEHWPSSAEVWLPEGRVPEAGETITNPAYAQLLRDLIAAGENAASREDAIDAARTEWKKRVGEAAERHLSVPHRHADGGDYAGVITAEDVTSFNAGYEDPVTIEFRGYTIAKTGPWGQGPVLLQTLKILEGYDDAELDPSTERGAHLILEAQKLAFADRDTYYGDTDVNLTYLLSDEYAAARRELITEEASAQFRPGDVPGTPKVLPRLVEVGQEEMQKTAGTGEPTVAKSGETKGDTCHIDVVDAAGNIISATPSGGWFQASPTIPELGFPLSTRLQMSWLDPESPSALAPGRRPRTTLTPTLVLKDGAPILALGTPGGDQQEQWQLPMLLRILLGGHSIQQALDAPTYHSTSLPGSFWPRTWEPGGAVVESRLGHQVIEGLRRRGHRITEVDGWSLGRMSAVARDPRTGQLSAGANARGAQGYAAGR